ncbi:hypothetical protein Droror1_Dr00017106 [Drosera rotundifolia]
MKILSLCLEAFVLLVVHSHNVSGPTILERITHPGIPYQPPLLVTEEKRRRTRSAGLPMLRSAARSATRRPLDIFFVVILLVLGSPLTIDSQQVGCSTSCVAVNCNSVGIRYGKYCGVGHSGCPGEKPCDDLDACCKIHDECVDKHGMTNVKCHEKFKRCIKRVQKSGKAGFSDECPYDVAVPTMVQGMDMAILMSQWANPKIEL